MAISAELVKELRERTGAGFLECKKALDENQNDVEKAIEAMRKSGQAKAAKKAGLNIIIQTVVWKKRVRSQELIDFLEFGKKNDIGIFLVKFGQYGSTEWVRTWAGVNKHGLRSSFNHKIAVSPDDNVIVAGDGNYIRSYDEVGNLQW